MTDGRCYWKLFDVTDQRYIGEQVAAESIEDAYAIFNRKSLEWKREDSMNPNHKFKIIRQPRNIYGWLITQDHLWEDSRLEGSLAEDEKPEVGRMGPRDMSPQHEEMLNLYLSQLESGLVPKRLEGQKTFKMYDDDGILYYTGIVIGEVEGDEPLVDFGRPNAGCTLIKYPRYPNMDSEA